MSKVHLSIKTTFGCPKGGRIRQVLLYVVNDYVGQRGRAHPITATAFPRCTAMESLWRR